MPDQVTEKRIYWAQIKCSRGHCVFGLAAKAENDEQAVAGKDACWKGFYKAVADGSLELWCPICTDASFRLEIRSTNFENIEEAMAVLAAISVEQDKRARTVHCHENN